MKIVSYFIQGILVGSFVLLIGLIPFSTEWWVTIIMLNILAAPVTNKIMEE